MPTKKTIEQQSENQDLEDYGLPIDNNICDEDLLINKFDSNYKKPLSKENCANF